MTAEFWIDKGFQLLVAGGGLAWLIRSLMYRDKIKAEAERIRAEAEVVRIKSSQEVLNNVMSQLKDVRNEYSTQAKEMGQMKVDHMKELEEERKSCAEQMKLLSEHIGKRLKELELLVNKKL